MPGVFAVGDVRSASVKRVGAAIGEGAQVVAALHRYLGGIPSRDSDLPPGDVGCGDCPPMTQADGKGLTAPAAAP